MLPSGYLIFSPEKSAAAAAGTATNAIKSTANHFDGLPFVTAVVAWFAGQSGSLLFRTSLFGSISNQRRIAVYPMDEFTVGQHEKQAHHES